jgi:hypothetical protein
MVWAASTVIALGAAAVGVGSAVMSSNAAGKAADAQAQSSSDAIGEQRRQYDQTRADYTPYREAGTAALGQLQTEMNAPVTAADAMSDPGYQFGLQQGQLGLDRKAAAGGGRVSGAALKAASEYATNYATTGYSAAYQRRQDRLNRLAALANVGQTSTAGSAAAGASSANAISGLVSAQGNAAGAAQLAQGNIWGNATNQLGAVASKWATTPAAYTPNSGGVDSGNGAGTGFSRNDVPNDYFG